MPKIVLFALGAVFALLIIITGIRIGLLLRSVSSYRSYWHKDAAKTPAPDSLTYIALGDSTAQGIGASSPRRGYVGLVAEFITKQTGRPVRVINISVSGAKVANAINKQLPQLATLPKADYITIEIGANDIAKLDEVVFRTQFEDLLKKLPSGVYVANIPSFKGGKKANLDSSAFAASQIIGQRVTERTDLHLVKLYETTSNQGILDFAVDLFHPSNRGYKNWARAFTDAIAKSKQ